mmetsp:Transcript_35847/g.40882  ORF Transcript_35847/g.40882 Transcript_35847/m.40882 type:complete len:946 (-) Transcript_35847:164-3001(-)|eukprot:CAMPEP_0194182762 /NCGR_PEP_ID=MMETSP0154-20130528/26923_1 /TAXON_ID=1049557 /ORGANISM="Thalassiothrix antarctica, Strain L6-D1" /LENGTH=945 /DNA_ID=CAMNT_0038899237 /DNA_START=36 /DNA_END=2873 /DNA_ORIENTATION=+
MPSFQSPFSRARSSPSQKFRFWKGCGIIGSTSEKSSVDTATVVTSDMSVTSFDHRSVDPHISVDSDGRPVRVFSASDPHDEALTTARRSNVKKLGTMNGVFVPCLSNILGIILFLRLTNITGQAGCIMTTCIILISSLSTFLTALSLSAIATNGEIQAGGPYYVISRTLGIEIGGPLGLLFYLGTTLATSMYVLGAIEAIQRTVGFHFDPRWASLILVWAIAAIVSIGVKYINMASNFFLCMVLVSISCMILGVILFSSGKFYGLLQPQDLSYMDNIWPNYQPDPVTEQTPNFWSLLAIFYPSVTGILAGSNRSGVLENPSTAIPRGTLGAIGFTTSIYLLVVWLFGLTMANPVLINDKFVVAAIAWPYEKVVAIGVIFSSIGAALQTCAGAPRVLSAIAMDDVLPFLSWIKIRDSEDDPIKAIWFTWFLASIPTLAGNLDHITPFVTMFFLLMYAGINLSCFFLGFLKTPGFRPTFKYFHWSTSLFGFILCLALVVFVINWSSALVVFLLFILLYAYTKRQRTRKEWGDVGNVLRYVIANSTLKALAGTQSTDFHAKNWRPQILTVVDTDSCGNPTNLQVLALASQLKAGGGGVHIVTSIMRRKDGMEKFDTCELVDHSEKLLKNHMVTHNLEDGFAQVIATTHARSQAIWSAIVHAGLGPLSANTVLMSYPTEQQRNTEAMEDYVLTLRGIMNLKKAILVFKASSGYPPSKEHHLTNQSTSSIDVWWIVHNGGLLLLLPYLLSKHELYQNVCLRIFAVTTKPTENPDLMRERIIDHLRKVRIRATVQVVDLSDTSIAHDMRDIESSSNILHVSHSEKITNLHNVTVGEVFSEFSNEIPYHAVSEQEGETGEGTSCFNNEPATLHPEDPTLFTDHNERLRTAKYFNHAIKQFSKQATLIVTNLPLTRAEEPPSEFFDYVDEISKGMKNMLLVRGSGIEVITTYV